MIVCRRLENHSKWEHAVEYECSAQYDYSKHVQANGNATLHLDSITSIIMSRKIICTQGIVAKNGMKKEVSICHASADKK